jgi:hypothetical protein
VDFVYRDEDLLSVLDDFSLAEETGCEGEDKCCTDDFPVVWGDDDLGVVETLCEGEVAC